MANSVHSETTHSYSWWWDSHISPKNSKWLQDNLTDIDGKVKSMIKIINEDADSFARRAEMYYKKRPELMKLVEEFYRAYRALAERYDHATGELRLAQRTMIEAFPDQVSFMAGDDKNKDGLKHLNEIFQTGEAILKELKTAEERLREGDLQDEKAKDLSSKRRSSLSSDKNHNLDLRTMILNQSEQAGKAEAETRRLKQALAQMEAERDSTLAQYQESLEKLRHLETELVSAQADAKELDEHVSEAEFEVKTLKESLLRLEEERDCSLLQFKEASERLASIEAMATEDAKSLEEKLRLADENAKRLREQNERAQSEVQNLKGELSRLNKEKDDAYQRYQQCLAMISRLQNELMKAKEEVERLKGEILLGSERLKGAEEQCSLLEKMNQSLKLEANDLVQEIAVRDRQLSEKQTELERLMNGLQDEQSHFMQVEGTLHTLQNMHIQSQEEQRFLALELKNGLQMLRDLEICKQDLELEILGLREENRGLNDLRLSSSLAEKDMQHDIKSLKEIKEKLEVEVKRQGERNEVLEKQIDQLKEEIADLYNKYQDLLQQVESIGIDPKCLMSSIKSLQQENSQLMQVSTEGKVVNEGLLRRLQDMEQKNSTLESSFIDVKVELESSKEKMKVLQESFNSLSGEKATVVAEKTALFSQLKIITDSMQKLLENNVILEKSLQGANIELEGLRVKSKGLEEFCQYLKDEKSSLVTERSDLAYRLECVGKRLEDFEMKFTKLEDKYAGLEKERDSSRSQVEELRICLDTEKQEYKCMVLTNEARLSGLDEHIRRLQEENKYRKKDFEEQLEKAVNAQVEIFILQKFMKDMEEKHNNLVDECHKHAEAVKYSEKIISELESENMMQHLEVEYLIDRVDKLRRGICQVLKALEIDQVSDGDPEIFLPRVRGKIKDMGRSLLDRQDENQQLLIQNSVLSAVIVQLSSDGQGLTTRKETVDHEFSLLSQQHVILKNEKNELLERSRRLDIVVDEKERGQETLKAQMEDLNLKLGAMEKEYVIVLQQHSDLLKANCFMQEKLSALEKEKHKLEEENSGTIMEALTFTNQSVVLKSSLVQAASELERVAHDMSHLREEYSDLENEARSLEEKLAMKKTENVQLRELIQQLEEKNKELNVCNNWLYEKCSAERERYSQKEAEHDEAEHRTRAAQAMNTELHTTIEGLQTRYKDVCDCREQQKKEIVLLKEANGNLESEMTALFEEFEACRVREVVLSSELHERSSEFELWEAEATSFYFDLQISSVREAVLESKVHEISGLYEDVNSRRNMEIDEMKNKISFLETEKEDLKCKMAAYLPAIASIKDNIASLEQAPALQTKLPYPSIKKQQAVESKELDISDYNFANAREQTYSVPDGLLELQGLQSRIKVIESKLIVGDISQQECVNGNINMEAGKEIEKLKSITNSWPDIIIHDVERKARNPRRKSLEFGPRSPAFRNKSHMKDISLDNVSDEIFEIPTKMRARVSPPRSEESAHIELEIGELNVFYPGEIEKELGVDKLEVSKNLSEPKQRGNNKAILERLASDAQKLASLQMSVQELKRRIDSNKKSKTTKDFEYKRLKGQLQDVENSALQLVEMNTEVTRIMEESSSSAGLVDATEPVEVEQALSVNMLEQTRRGSEKIESLQLEMQKIGYILVKLDDENIGTNSLVKNRFSRIRTGIVLREFVYNYGRRNRKNKNSRLCGCFRPSNKEVRGS